MNIPGNYLRPSTVFWYHELPKLLQTHYIRGFYFMKTKSMAAFALCIFALSGNLMAAPGKKRSYRKYPKPPQGQWRAPSPQQAAAPVQIEQRFAAVHVHFQELQRRSPQHMPGALSDFYGNLIGGCNILLASIKLLKKSMHEADFDYTQDLGQLTWLFRNVKDLRNNTNIKLTGLSTNSFAALAKLGVEEEDETLY